jgi:hypothetical protein
VGSWFPLIPLKRVPLKADGDTRSNSWLEGVSVVRFPNCPAPSRVRIRFGESKMALETTTCFSSAGGTDPGYPPPIVMKSG